MRRITIVTLAILASGCVDLRSRLEEDRGGLRRQLERRTGVAWPASEEAAGSIAPQVRELLADPLTEEAAVRIAVLNNRDVRAALARQGVASAELVQAGLLQNPVFTANAKLFDSGTEIEVGIVQSFLEIFFLSARRRVAEVELDAVQARIASELVGLVHDVRRAFVEVRAAEATLAMERENLRAAEASRELMAMLHRAGNVLDPELTAEELGLAEAKLGVARGETGLFESRESLNVLLGLWGEDVTWTVAGPVERDELGEVEVSAVEGRAVAASLALAQMRAEATARAREAGIVRWEAYLEPEAGAVAKKEVDESEWGVGPEIGFAVPLFDTGAARRAAAAESLRESLARQVSAAVEVRSAARRLAERARALREEALFLRDVRLPLAARLVRETLRNYNAMQIGVFDVFRVKQQQIETARRLAETTRDARLARIDLDELLAGRLDEGRVHAVPASTGGAPAAPSDNGGHE
jgi:cobalt-zinc-cadmium efflux system outer membrane protein